MKSLHYKIAQLSEKRKRKILDKADALIEEELNLLDDSPPITLKLDYKES